MPSTMEALNNMSRRIGRALRALALATGVLALVAALPATASAQYGAPSMSDRATGEKYHIEASGAIWNPAFFGKISSEQFGLLGTSIDFFDDLGFVQTRFKDFQIVLRPAKKHKFRLQYTPILYQAETTLKRDVIFNGVKFPFAIPIQSEFGWKVWRIGYEYDFVYRNRGFVGVLLDLRYTEYTAAISSVISDEFAQLKAPLPAIGVVGRAYVLPNLALHFEFSGMTLPNIDPKYKASYKDIDVHGTFNVTNNIGLNVGWRYMSTFMQIKKDVADLRFKGLWFGASLRY